MFFRTRAHCVLVVAGVLTGPIPALTSVAMVPLSRMNGQLDMYAARAARNIAYFGPVHVGEPQQTFAVCFDTGSADFWLHSSQCADESCAVHKLYNPLLSSTARVSPLEEKWQWALASC